MMGNMTSDKIRMEYVNYWFSLVNHIVIVILAVIRFVQNPAYSFMMTTIQGAAAVEEDSLYAYQCESTAYFTGYFISDFIVFVIPMALEGNYAYIFHHLVSIGLGIISPYVPISAAKYCPRIMLIECSSIAFAVRFIYKKSGFSDARIITALSCLFGISFFVVRVYSIFGMILQMVDDIKTNPSTLMSFIIFSFGVLWCMQVWWFFKILRIILSYK
jgi:hypothetical protein